MTTSYWQRPQKAAPRGQQADVVIVGGGFVGLSCAYWISEYRPGTKIIICEKDSFGNGASGRNAGFLTLGSAAFYQKLSIGLGAENALKVFQFAQRSLDLLKKHILASTTGLDYQEVSSLTLFQSEKDFEQWQKSDFQPDLYNFEWKDSNQLAKSIQNKFFGAFQNGPEYKMNPLDLLRSLRQKLVKRGVHFMENTSVYEVVPEGIRSEVDFIKCQKVVLALNGHLSQFHEALGNLVRPYRAQMMAVELENEIDSTSLHYDPSERVYWRTSHNNILLIGGKRLLDPAGDAGDFDKVSAVIQRGLESYLADCLKVRFKTIQRWSGIMGFTDRELPIISKLSAPVDTYLVAGFSGHGMGLGFHSGKEIAELISGNQNKSFFDYLETNKIKL
jgi:gamma-glutamylputrescine oxidase